MKKLIILCIIVMLTATVASAQKQYGFGYKVAPVTKPSALAVSVTPYSSFTQYEIAADTNITITVVVTKSLPGDLLSFKIKANTRNRTITFGNGIKSVAPTITGGKTVTYLFIYNGTNYYICGSGATD